MFLKLLISKSHVTRFAATQFVIMQARTSFILRKALSRPGIAPQSAPASMPPRKAMSQTRNAPIVSVGRLRASIRETIVPMRYWPGAPMLNRPVLYATAMERPVIMSGVARKSMLPTLVGLKPQLSTPVASRPVLNIPAKIRRMPSHAPLVEMLLLVRPTMRMTRLPTTRPIRMDSSDATTFCVESFA